MPASHSATAPRKQQRGAALIVILLLLLIVTLLGIAGIRGALLQERMAANALARSQAFQISEAALREGEGFAASKPPAPTSGCTNGVCVTPTGMTPAWQADDFWTSNSGWRLGRAVTLTDGVTQVQPRFVVERYGQAEAACATAEVDMSAPECAPTTDIYRITSRTQIPDGAEVILQSLFQVP